MGFFVKGGDEMIFREALEAVMMRVLGVVLMTLFLIFGIFLVLGLILFPSIEGEYNVDVIEAEELEVTLPTSPPEAEQHLELKKQILKNSDFYCREYSFGEETDNEYDRCMRESLKHHMGQVGLKP